MSGHLSLAVSVPSALFLLWPCLVQGTCCLLSLQLNYLTRPLLSTQNGLFSRGVGHPRNRWSETSKPVCQAVSSSSTEGNPQGQAPMTPWMVCSWARSLGRDGRDRARCVGKNL